LGGAASPKFKVKPVVVLSILDHYKRRNEGLESVVGTLLGERHGNIVHITDSFPVPFHVENQEKASFDKEYHDNMLKLQKAVNPKVEVVGWYTTGDKITYISSLMHQHYTTECESPVLLTVDVGLTNSKMAVRAYTGTMVTRNDPVVAAHYQAATGQAELAEPNANIVARFAPAPLEYYSHEAERVGVDSMINGIPEGDGLDAPASLPTELDNLERSLMNLKTSIDTIQLYVQKVQAGEISGDPVLGRQIANALSQVPYFSPTVFNENVQDLLMIVYLANITRTQIALASKIHTLA